MGALQNRLEDEIVDLKGKLGLSAAFTAATPSSWPDNDRLALDFPRK